MIFMIEDDGYADSTENPMMGPPATTLVSLCGWWDVIGMLLGEYVYLYMYIYICIDMYTYVYLCIHLSIPIPIPIHIPVLVHICR